ncbi:MAG: ABC transporter ATP-binding protein [Bacteroidales bacterium]
MGTTAVDIRQISKSYGTVNALKDINLQVTQGELFGLIGPDGAGKTTLFRILTTLILPDTGKVIMEGLDVIKEYRKIRNIVGYMPGRFSLYQDLTVEENLNFFATIFGTTVQENYHLIKDIYSQIEPFKKRPAGKLSGGMKQKLALSCCLVHKPKVLILDEPTTGVDAISRKEFWEMLRRLKGEGITILVSTPYMDEASLCDRIALIQEGQLMMVDTPDRIPDLYKGQLWSASSNKIYQLLTDLKNSRHVEKAYLFGQNIHFTVKKELFDENQLYANLEAKDHSDLVIKKIKPGIEDSFIELMSEVHKDEQ